MDNQDHMSLGRIEVSMGRLEERLKSMEHRLQNMESDTAAIEMQINKWKGALLVVLVLGASAGWMLTSWDAVKRLFR